MKRGIVLALLPAVGAVSIWAGGSQGPAAPPPLDIQKVKDNLYMDVPNGGSVRANIQTAYNELQKK